MKQYIGIDLGGTGIKGAVVREDGEILARQTCPTRPQRGPAAVPPMPVPRVTITALRAPLAAPTAASARAAALASFTRRTEKPVSSRTRRTS